jgi:transcriptional regulator with XRE-family HTH domain
MDKKKKALREDKVWERKELDLLKALGDNIVRIKKEKKLTSKDIYEALELDKSNYRRIEAGKTNVSVLLLNRIAKTLDTTLSELVKISDKK